MNEISTEREYDFALILSEVSELNTKIEDALFEAGCDDATLSVQYGCIYMEFSRRAPSLSAAILSAIQDVRRANIGADVLRVDECNLVSPAEIARRIGRSRQLVNQFMNGSRGPGGFPAPVCNLKDDRPLWAWGAVSYWLYQNDMIRPEQLQDAEIASLINNALENARQKKRNPELVEEVFRAVASLSSRPTKRSRSELEAMAPAKRRQKSAAHNVKVDSPPLRDKSARPQRRRARRDSP